MVDRGKMPYEFDDSRIELALQKANDTRRVFIGSNLLADTHNIFKECFDAKKAVVVADENTFSAAGKNVYEKIKVNNKTEVEPFIFPGEPMLYADYQNALKLEGFLKLHDAIPVAVGSGTINDLTKLASYRCNRPYMVVGTAASMDGYTSYGAAITKDGFKQTIPCSAPYAVMVDLDIAAKAPYRMTASGYADLLGKITAGADWIIADSLGIDPIDAHAWSLVQDSLRESLKNPRLLQEGDIPSYGRLVEGLVLSGLSMQAIQASRPASGSEHQFSHYWEMHETEHGVVSHGFKVGVGSIASAALYEQVLEQDLQQIDIPEVCAEWPTKSQLEASVRESFSNPRVAQEAVDHSLAKYIDAQQLAVRLEKVKELWPTLQKKLRAHVLPANEIYDMLHEAGCPVHPNKIGHSLSEMRSSYFYARKIRSRYTIFDFAAETGCFEKCVDELFEPDGFWEKAAVS